MINWFFNKRGPFGALFPAPAPAAKPPPAAAKPAPPPRAASPRSVAPPAPVVDWAARLQAALGDDAALLQMAQDATVLDVKLAAVAALSAEAALKQAERALRSHDRKVHRLAKQRLEAAVTQRETRAQAQALLLRTRDLLDEEQVPINHLVVLDRDWQALPAAALEPAQVDEFTALRAQLDSQTRERADAEQRLKQWRAEARRLLAGTQAALRQTAAAGSAAEAQQQGLAVQGTLDKRPPLCSSAGIDDALAQAAHAAAAVHACLAHLEAPPPQGSDAEAWPVDLQGLDADITASLEGRLAQWWLMHRPPSAAPATPPPPDRPARPPRQPPKQPPLDPAQRQALADLLQRAEASRDEGQLGEMQQHLQSFESALAASCAALPAGLRARQQALWAEQGRLRDWQQWGGERARDDLVAEAVALERLTLAAAPAVLAPISAPADAPAEAPVSEGAEPATAAPEAAPEVAPATAVRPVAGALKLNLQTHADAIRALRLRWKALDRVGAAASQAQWQTFDAALQTAHQPVAAQQAAMQAQRLDNLATREALLAGLEIHDLGDAAATGGEPSADWRACIRELDRFNTEWRKLGPVEHTVPRAAQQPLQQRLLAALARVEAPLQAARAAAATERARLIALAEALVPASGAAPAPEAARHVRDLQALWQDAARRLPLPRGLETALWARFKTATDAVFAQREAALTARDAELAANLAHAQSLLQRLLDLTPDMPPAQIERTLTEVDRAWRQGGEVPRGALDGLETRYRKACEAAAQHIGAAVQQRWQAQCETLLAKVALCEAREAREDREASEKDTCEEAARDQAPDAEAAARWTALPSLPAPWEQPLAQRWSDPLNTAAASTAKSIANSASQADEWLLRLELALGLPASPQWQAARQALKLRALKDTMEGRGAPQDGPPQQAVWLQSLLRQTGLDAARRSRLRALLAALREAQPGALGSPTGTP